MSLGKYKDKIFTVEVTDLNNLGYGVCRVDGIVTFVGGTVDGDKVKIKIIKTARDYMVARTEEIIEPSPYRISPECPATRKCGGCVYGLVSYEHELELKRRYIEGAMRKHRLEAFVAPVVSDGRVWGWRNKVQYPVGENWEIGYYRRHTHEISGIADCGLEAAPLRGIAPFVAQWLKAHKLPARHIYLRCGEGTGEVMVCVVTRAESFPYADEFAAELVKRFPAVVSVMQNINPKDTNVILGEKWRLIWGREYIEDLLCGCRFKIAPQAFYQVNRGCAELLYRRAAELAFDGACEGRFVLADLYCGVGTIGICAASMRQEVKLVGVEVTPEAVENAAYNAKKNGIDDADFICAEIGDDFRLPEAVYTADAVIVDPPRKGLAGGLINTLADAEVRKVVYVSCNPDTLARDIALFAQRGYRFGAIEPFDMFPRTGNVKCHSFYTLSPC